MKEIKDMALEAGFTADEFAWHDHIFECLEALVRADEREALKAICKAEQTEDSSDLWNVCCTHIINKINERKA